MNQLDLVAAICNELEKQKVPVLCQRQMSSVISAATLIINECEAVPVMAYPGMGLSNWLRSDDTGASSRYMAIVLGGGEGKYAHPHDMGDFGRCSRLLDAVPEFRGRLHLMKSKGEVWSLLVDRWSEIEALISEGRRTEANEIVMSIPSLAKSASAKDKTE